MEMYTHPDRRIRSRSGFLMLTVGSTFTGVGGADLGLEWAGFRIAWQCELDPWKRSILAAHWPEVPIYDDIQTLDIQAGSKRSVTRRTIGDAHRIAHTEAVPVDVLVGGFPCQDLSVAGKRKGFDGERSILAFQFLRVAESMSPRWLILENVPGLLSSNRGRDFARLVDEVVACGYGVCWRVLDAQYFGVPQRRRRIFLVARRADAVINSRFASRLALRALLESGSGDLTPGWPPRQDTPAGVRGGAASGGRIFNATAQFGAWVEDDTAGTLSQRDYKSSNHLLADPIAFGHTQGIDIQPSETKIPTLRAGDGGGAVAFRKSARVRSDDTPETWVDDGIANTLNSFDVGDSRTTRAVIDTGGVRMDAESAGGGQLVPEKTQIRRLTPVECERLMGWPDGWTAPEGVKALDSKRYAACGDGIVSWVAYWIGQRIRMIDEGT
jgi:DNA (cytosine-5)-methyltransferase 1